MRFMYETVAETAGHISFDSVDPFYDSLPWFRLIGRYVSNLNIKVDHDLSLLSSRPLYLSFYFNFSPGTRSIFSPFGLVTFYPPPPPPCCCSIFPFSTFVAFSRNFFFSRALLHSVSSSRLHWSLFSLPIAFFPCDLPSLYVFASKSSSSVILVLFFFQLLFFLHVSLIDCQNEIHKLPSVLYNQQLALEATAR